MQMRIRGMTILLAAVIATGCSADEIKEKQDLPNETLSPTEEENGENIAELLLSDFFLANGQKHIIRVKVMNLQHLILK